MADEAQLFRTLVDDTGSAVAMDAVQSGDAPSTQNGILSFSFRDSSGNIVLPQLDAAGKLPVTFDAGSCLFDYSKQTPAGVGSGNSVDMATLTLATSSTYKNIEYDASCFRDSVIQIVQNDNAVETVLWEGLVGSGQVHIANIIKCLEVTTGAIGTQELILRGYNTDKVSDIRGSLAAELPA